MEKRLKKIMNFSIFGFSFTTKLVIKIKNEKKIVMIRYMHARRK